MSGRLIRAPRGHYCRPGWTEYTIPADNVHGARTGVRPTAQPIDVGDVWECGCGRTWVAYFPPRSGAMALVPRWRPERRLERWRRTRRARSHRQVD